MCVCVCVCVCVTTANHKMTLAGFTHTHTHTHTHTDTHIYWFSPPFNLHHYLLETHPFVSYFCAALVHFFLSGLQLLIFWTGLGRHPLSQRHGWQQHSYFRAGLQPAGGFLHIRLPEGWDLKGAIFHGSTRRWVRGYVNHHPSPTTLYQLTFPQGGPFYWAQT